MKWPRHYAAEIQQQPRDEWKQTLIERTDIPKEFKRLIWQHLCTADALKKPEPKKKGLTP